MLDNVDETYPRVHEEGAKAFSNYVALDQNPYASHDPRWRYWHEGWNDAQDYREQEQ